MLWEIRGEIAGSERVKVWFFPSSLSNRYKQLFYFVDDVIPDHVKKGTDKEKQEWLNERVEEIFQK